MVGGTGLHVVPFEPQQVAQTAADAPPPDRRHHRPAADLMAAGVRECGTRDDADRSRRA
jgi:hypothetical protein